MKCRGYIDISKQNQIFFPILTHSPPLDLCALSVTATSRGVFSPTRRRHYWARATGSRLRDWRGQGAGGQLITTCESPTPLRLVAAAAVAGISLQLIVARVVRARQCLMHKRGSIPRGGGCCCSSSHRSESHTHTQVLEQRVIS